MAIKRINTLRFKFNKSQQRPMPAEIHDFIIETLKLSLDQLIGVQLNSVENTVYVKLVSQLQFERTLSAYSGTLSLKLNNGEVVDVDISDAGKDDIVLRLFNVPFEATEEDVRSVLMPYGKVGLIMNERWSKNYRVQGLQNGLKAVHIELSKPVPSYLRLDGIKIQVVYDGQPQSCYVCNEFGHIRSSCPVLTKRGPGIANSVSGQSSTADTRSSSRLFANVVKPVLSMREELTENVVQVTKELPINMADQGDVMNTPTPSPPTETLVPECFPAEERRKEMEHPHVTVDSLESPVKWSEDVESLEKNEDSDLDHEHDVEKTIKTAPLTKRNKSTSGRNGRGKTPEREGSGNESCAPTSPVRGGGLNCTRTRTQLSNLKLTKSSNNDLRRTAH